MDHVGANTEDRQNYKRKVIVCRNDNAFARSPRRFDRAAIAVNRSRHLWRRKHGPRTTCADRDLQVVIISIGERFIMEEADDHSTRFILNGWDTRDIHFGILAGSTACAAAAIQVNAVGGIVFPGGCITDSKTSGIFDDDPGKKQAAELDYAED